jgi:DNA primase
MTTLTFHAETIKERVTMRDAIARYCPNVPPRKNRIPCPVHGGTNYNLGFTDRLYHCFTCGSGGDVIHFAQHIFGIDFPTAIERLDTDFSLGLPLNRRLTLREQRDAERQLREITARREHEAAERIAHERLYDSLHDEYARLERNKYMYAPQDQEEEWHPLFCEALRRLPAIQYEIDTLL